MSPDASEAKTICVYASSSEAVAQAYKTAAARLGMLLAQRNHTLIYGAGNIGLMGEMGRACKQNGGRMIGVIPEKLRDLELADAAADELVITGTMRERKATMEERADAFIALPGGFGTLEEVLEVLTLKQLWYHQKPIVFLNIEGFYNKLIAFIEHLYAEQFTKADHRNMYALCTTPEEALDYIARYTPSAPHRKWF